MVGIRAGSPHTGINSTGLVRLLASLGLASAGMGRPSGADKLGHWLDWTDDIALSTALADQGAPAAGGHAGRARAPSNAAASAQAAQAARSALTGLRAELLQAITAQAPQRAPAGPPDEVVDPAPYRQAYQAQQRAMQARSSSLRDLVRQMLLNGGPPLSRLAALDAVLDKALAGRERQLLSALPSLMEKHFKALRQARQAGWLEAFGQDTQAMLMAELEIRLLPIEGMMQALMSTLAVRQPQPLLLNQPPPAAA